MAQLKSMLVCLSAAIVVSAGFASHANAQAGQCLGGGCGSAGTQHPASIASTTSNTFVVVATNFWPGDYSLFNVTSGQIYEWSMCPADTGATPAYDPQLTLFNDAALLTPICFSDDVCSPLYPKIRWTATFTGVARIKIDRWSGGNCASSIISNSSLAWRCETCTPPAPTNDNCAAAIALTLGGSAHATNMPLATNDGTASCDPGGASSRDVWYTVTLASALTSQQILRLDTCGSAGDTTIALFSGVCGSLVELACNDNCGGAPCSGPSSCLLVPGLPAGTYRVRVSDKGLPSGIVNTRAAVDLVNDLCTGAITIACPSVTSHTTIGSTLETGLPTVFGPSPNNNGGNLAISAPGVWYRIVGTGDTVSADTITNPPTLGYDTKLHVFTGSCGSLTAVTGNDDIASTFRSKVRFRTVLGQDYYIRVSGFSTTGNFVLTVSCAPSPLNDDCATPTIIGPSNGSIAGATFGATGERFDNNSIVLTNCATNTSNPVYDVWYSYTAPCSGNVTFDTCGAFDTLLSVHSACPTFTVGNQIGSSCNQNGPGLCNPGSQLTINVTAGTTYLIRVAQNIGANAGGNFTLTWSGVTSPALSISCPSTVTVSCSADVPPANFAGGTVSACATVTPMADVISGQTCPNRYQISRTYVATDGFGNTANCTQIITVDDQTGPVIVAGSIGSCYDDIASAEADAIAATMVSGNNCGGSVTYAATTVGTCSAVITVIAEDTCGNLSNAVQYNTRIDNEDPVAIAGVIAACYPDVASAETAAKAATTATDNCTTAGNFSLAVGTVGTCSAVITVIVADECGNIDSIIYNTRIDNTAPVITGFPSDATGQCASDVPAADIGLVSATDNCGDLVTITHVGDVNNGGAGCSADPLIVTRTYRATDTCGNFVDQAQTITIIDSTPPVVTFCPSNITVNADAGGCTAVVDPGLATFSDNCGGTVTVTGTRSDSQALNAPYPAGTTTISWTGTDPCGNVSLVCSQDIIVQPFNEVLVSVNIPGFGTGSRCITLVFHNCTGPAETVDATLNFVAGSVTNEPVLVACGSYTCVTGRDRLHTLRRTTSIGTSGTSYTVALTGPDALISGNLNDDMFIDILDFGGFVGQFGANYGSPNTNCATSPVHADFDGDSLCFTNDFTFISTSFLTSSEANCCGLPLLQAPLAKISVEELIARGLAQYVIADLNGDGMLDMLDVALFASGVQPGVQTSTFTGEDGGSWFDSGNWSNDGLPNAMTDVTIPTGVVIDGLGAVARNVMIDAGGSLTLLPGASLKAEALTVSTGGQLSVNGETTLLDVTSLTLETGAELAFDGGLIQVTGGVFSKADPHLVIGGTPALSVLRLLGGATASILGDTFIGNDAGDRGRIEVIGLGTAFATSGNLFIGFGGDGALVIQTGAGVSSTDAFMAFGPSAIGEASIEGEGSVFATVNTLEVGGEGTALLRLDHAGRASATTIHLGENSDVAGAGVLQGAVSNRAAIRPGAETSTGVGTMVVDGGVTQASAGSVTVRLGGSAPGVQHDLLAVQGNALLSGVLKVKLAPGYVPAMGESFVVMTADHVQGQFASVQLPTVAQGTRLQVVYAPHAVVLEVTPAATADLNADGIVDAADLAVVLGAWGPCPATPAACLADLNGDGLIGSADLAIVLGRWGSSGL